MKYIYREYDNHTNLCVFHDFGRNANGAIITPLDIVVMSATRVDDLPLVEAEYENHRTPTRRSIETFERAAYEAKTIELAKPKTIELAKPKFVIVCTNCGSTTCDVTYSYEDAGYIECANCGNIDHSDD